jgi:hypothetical protein
VQLGQVNNSRDYSLLYLTYHICALLYRHKVLWDSETGPGMTDAAAGTGLNTSFAARSAVIAKVLDVTRLKRAVSHHTRRYLDYR